MPGSAPGTWPNPPESLDRVWHYAAFSDEIDDLLNRQAAIAEREQAAAQRERAILP